jgi:hypothetical protein
MRGYTTGRYSSTAAHHGSAPVRASRGASAAAAIVNSDTSAIHTFGTALTIRVRKVDASLPSASNSSRSEALPCCDETSTARPRIEDGRSTPTSSRTVGPMSMSCT